MTTARQVRIAALVGAVAELIFVTPLLILSVSHFGAAVPLPAWVLPLETLQKPGFPLAEHLYLTHAVSSFASHFPRLLVLCLAQGLGMLMQAAIFACFALGVSYLLRSGKAMRRVRSLLRGRVLLALFFPPAILIIAGAVWPIGDFIDPNIANGLVIASISWIALAALTVGTMLAVTRESPRTRLR